MNIEFTRRAHVGYVDTPLEPMENLAKKLGKGKLYIKRDDLTGLALGGNKTRKLDYLVRHALDNGYTALLTYGGVQTNHGRLTAAAAVKFGMKSILMLAGKKPDYMSGNLVLERLMGADIYFVEDEDRLAECAQKVIAQYEAGGDKVLDIPMGGSNMIGAAGYIGAIPELLRQMEDMEINAGKLVVGMGSIGTFSGLLAGAKYYKAPFDIIGVPVIDHPDIAKNIVRFTRGLSETYSLGIEVDEGDVHIERGADLDIPYAGIGYNVPDSATQDAIALLASTEAIFVDPCYTGKAFRGFVDMVARGRIAADEGAIFLHTGGVPALWSKEHLDALQARFWRAGDYTVFPKE